MARCISEAEEKLIVSKYVNEKKSMETIAKEMQLSSYTVHNRLHKYNVTIRPQVTEETKERLRTMNIGRNLTAEEKKKIGLANKKGGLGSAKFIEGYKAIYFPDHPQSKGGYVLEHRLIMECLIGRRLKEDECVHHINGVRIDNRKENLQLMTQKEHKAYHMKERYK